MINLKKIGLTALAGSLVAFSANAVELGVTGGSEVTYTSTGGSDSVSGNRFGAATSMKFSGSGDVGFGTATIVRTLRDNQSAASYSSAYTTLDLGDMGVLSFDTTGGGLVGTAANDDILPTAYEEVWHEVGTGNGTVGISAKNVLGYRHTMMGVSLSAGYSAANNGTGNGDGGISGQGGTGSTWDINLSTPVPYVEGLTLAGGFAENQGTGLKSSVHDTAGGSKSWTSHLLYNTGPWAMGVRMAANQKGSTNVLAGGASVEGETAMAGSVAYNVNDALTVSYAQQDVEYDKNKVGILTATADTAAVTETSRAFNAAYTMGAATIRGTLSKASDVAGVTGNKDEHMEISLVLSF
jgi:outer membrane protein OmpU